MLDNKIIQPFIEHFLNKALNDFITDPRKTLERLSGHHKFKDIIKKLQDSPLFLKHLKKTLENTDRRIINRFALNIFHSLNRPKAKILHFDFQRNPILKIKEIESLFKKADNLLYACFFLKENSLALYKLLKETDSLFFLFLEKPELNRESINIFYQTDNVCLLLPARDKETLQSTGENLKCFLFGAYIYLNNNNLLYYINSEFLLKLGSTNIAFLVYIREEKLTQKNNKLYEDFLNEVRFRYFPVFDFHKDQKYLLENLPKE